jgi:hypothetical protein
LSDDIEVKGIEGMSWFDILDLRSKMLPLHCNLLSFFENKQEKFIKLNKQPDDIYKFIDEVQKEYFKVKDEYQEAVYKLNIGSFVKFAGAAFGGGLATMLTMGNPKNYLAGVMTGLGLFAVSMYKEITEVMAKHRRMKTHRLHFLDTMTK